MVRAGEDKQAQSQKAKPRQHNPKPQSTPHTPTRTQVPPPRAAEPLYQALDEILSGDSGSGVPGGEASLGADFADSTWHGFLARHTRHRRHHSRRRSAEAAAAAAMTAVAAAAEAEAAAVGVGGGEEVCCGHMGEGPAEGGRAPWHVEGDAAAAAPDDDGWAAERARRLQQSREKEEEEEEEEDEDDEEEAEKERRELRTFKTTAVFGADKRAEEAAGWVGAGPGHKA